MPELHGRASFPGVQSVLSCSYTMSHGISPSVGQMEIVPQAGVGLGGTLVLFDGVTTITLRDCRVDQSSVRLDQGGFVTSLSILDRRWKWAFGEISGMYNRRMENGALDLTTEKTPQQLVALCLQAM